MARLPATAFSGVFSLAAPAPWPKWRHGSPRGRLRREGIRQHSTVAPWRAGSGPAGLWRNPECQRSLPSSPLPQLALLADSSDHSVSPFPGSPLSAVSGWRAAETFPDVCQLGFTCIWRQTCKDPDGAEVRGALASLPSRNLHRKVQRHSLQPTR